MEFGELVNVVKEAGRYAKEQQATASGSTTETGSTYEEEKQAFSEIDGNVQEMILKAIPDDWHVLAEETTNKTQGLHDGYTLIIDPIDGTSNYLNKNDDRDPTYWGVSVAITKGTEIVSGVMYFPQLDILLTTEKGKGTQVNGETITLNPAEFNKADYIRVSGAVEQREELRALFAPEPKLIGAFVVKFLTMLNKHTGKLPQLPECSAYIGNNTIVWDLGCAELAWREAGGSVLNKKNEECTLLEHLNEDRITTPFFFVPNNEYGNALQDYVKGHI